MNLTANNMAEIISSFIGGAFLVLISIDMDKAIQVVVMALAGGLIGSFAKGAGTWLWTVTHKCLSKLKRRRKR